MTNKTEKIIRLSVSYLILLVAAIIVIYPLLWVLGSSFNPGQSLSGSTMFPENPTLKHFKSLFDTENSNYVLWYLNSMKISLVTMVFAVISVAVTGYAFLTLPFYRKKKWTANLFSPTNDSKLRCADCNFCTCSTNWTIRHTCWSNTYLCRWTDTDEYVADERIFGYNSKRTR